MGLSRDQILKADDCKIISVPVPEWGGEVSVKTFSGEDRDLLELLQISDNAAQRTQRQANWRARVASMTICDEQGTRLFTDRDIAALGKKSGVALQRVYEAAISLNAIRPEDIEELTKNSNGDPSGVSGSV